MSLSLPADVKTLSWAAEQLGIGVSTAYRIVGSGQIPGAFRVGGQWRISVPRFLRVVHGGQTVESEVLPSFTSQPKPAQGCSPVPDHGAPTHGHIPAR